MTFKKRLAVLGKSAHRHNYVSPIIIPSIVDLSVDGPKEVGAFAQFQINGVCHTMECKADETQQQFESRIQSQLQSTTKTLI